MAHWWGVPLHCLISDNVSVFRDEKNTSDRTDYQIETKGDLGKEN